VKKELEKHYRKYDYEHGKIEKCLPIWVSELSISTSSCRTVNMFLQSEKMWHDPNLKDIYEVMRSRETQMNWMRWKLFRKIYSNETRDVIKMIQEEWESQYRRHLECLGITDFISKLPELWQATHDEINNDYYLETLDEGYDEDRYRKKFKCEPMTNPTYDEHDKKEREAFYKRNDWIRTSEYLEQSIVGRKSPYETFADAYGDWLYDHEAPNCPRGTRKKKRAIAEANSEPAAKKRKVEDSSAPKFKSGNWYYNLKKWGGKAWYYVHRRFKLLDAEYIEYSCPELTDYKGEYLTEKIERGRVRRSLLVDRSGAEYIDVKHQYRYEDGKSTLCSDDKFMGDVTMDTIFKSELHRRMKQLFVSYSKDAARKDLERFKEAKIIEELEKERDRLNKIKADKNPTGSNPHDVKSDMMKGGIAGENKGNCQMSDESDRRMTVLMNVFEAYVTSMLKKNVTGMDFASMSGPLENEEVMNLLATVNFNMFEKLLTTNDSSITHVNDNKNTLAIMTRNRQTGQRVTILLNVPCAKDRVPIINAMYDLASKNDDQALLEETLKHGKEYVIEKYKVRENMKKQNDLDEELVKKRIMKKVVKKNATSPKKS